jgi:tRNA-specific 2-thiouridylase
MLGIKEGYNMEKVVLGLSGGVDSSVCLYLLKKEGYEVLPIFMRNWDSAVNNDILGNPTINDDVCPQSVDLNDAKSVCDTLGFNLETINFQKEYWDHVFKYFLAEYKENRTPNPDILCNKEIKFKSFLNHALNLNADYIAMGHYAKVIKEDGHAYLFKAKDLSKDQSYFLCMLSEDVLKKSILPLADITKKEVREIAFKLNLKTYSKKDSTGICFIGERRFKEFLKNYIPSRPGNIVSDKGEFIGRHDGVMYYTIGQRKGLNIGGVKNYLNDAWFVYKKDLKNNILYVCQGHNNKLLLANRLIAKNLNIISKPIIEGKIYSAKFRYRDKDHDVTIKYLTQDKIEVDFLNLERAITPGQVVCIYDKDMCMGGAFIDEVYYNDIRRA